MGLWLQERRYILHCSRRRARQLRSFLSHGKHGATTPPKAQYMGRVYYAGARDSTERIYHLGLRCSGLW